MIRVYKKVDKGLEMSFLSPDKKKLHCKFRFSFDDGLFVGQNFLATPSVFVREMSGFADYVSKFVWSYGRPGINESWLDEHLSLFQEYDIDSFSGLDL